MKLYFMFGAVLLFSCNDTAVKQKKGQLTDLEKLSVLEKDIVADGKCSDLIGLDSLVFLECTDSSLIGSIKNVIVTNGRIYVLDRWESKGVYCFDSKGNYLQGYVKKGGGPGEYDEVVDMSFHNDEIYLLVEPLCFYVLDMNLDYKRTIKLNVPGRNFSASALSVVNSDTVIVVDDDMPYKFNFYSFNKGTFVSHQSPSKGAGYETFYPAVSRSPDGRFFVSERYNDTVFMVSGDRLEPAYYVEFEKPLTEAERFEQANISPYDVDNKKIGIKKMYGVHAFCDNGQHVTFMFRNKALTHFYFKDKASGKVTIFPIEITNDVFGTYMLNYTVGYFGKSVVTWVDPVELVANKKQLNITLPKGFDEQSNPVLVFYHYK